MKSEIGKYAVPANIRKMKPTGTMVKYIHNKYYVYKYSCKKDSNNKWKTKMGRVVGFIDEKLGFIPNDTYNFKDEITTLEYGQYALAFNNSPKTIEKLKLFFNSKDAFTIYLLAIIHVVNGFVHLKNINTIFKQSYFTNPYSSLSFSYHSLTKLLDSLGRKQTRVFEFEQSLLNESSKEFAIDGHVIKSTSHSNDLAEYGNKYSLLQDMQLNVLVAFDINTNIPLVSRIYSGGTLDKTSVKDLLDLHLIENALFVVDRGFYSEGNITLFSKNNNHYIIPLSANLIKYKEATKELIFTEQFLYEKSKKITTIEYKKVKTNNSNIYVLRDTEQNLRERTDYLKNIEIDSKKYTTETFEKIKNYFGLFVLETNLELEAKDVYEKYKKRWQIETYFNYFENKIDFNELSLNDYYATQGLSFIMLIASLVHHELKENLKCIKGKSVSDLLLETRFFKINKINNSWKIGNIKEKSIELLKNCNIDVRNPFS